MADNNVMLTTIDNVYNPFTQFDEWYSYDLQMGYNTLNLLARLAETSVTLSDERESEIINGAMNEIVSFNLSGKHILVSEKNFAEDLRQGKKRLSNNLTA